MCMHFYYAFDNALCLSLCTFIRVERFMYFYYVYVFCSLILFYNVSTFRLHDNITNDIT